MSAAMGIAVGAGINASIASQRAHEAKVLACGPLVSGFHAETATTEQMQAYADCVEALHPSGADIPDPVLKSAFVLALLGMAAGGWLGRRDPWGGIDWIGIVAAGFIGFVALPFAAAFIYGLVIGIAWLFT